MVRLQAGQAVNALSAGLSDGIDRAGGVFRSTARALYTATDTLEAFVQHRLICRGLSARSRSKKMGLGDDSSWGG
jgi:hypothetical protein